MNAHPSQKHPQQGAIFSRCYSPIASFLKPYIQALPCTTAHPKASVQTPPRPPHSAPQNSLVAEATHVTTLTRSLARRPFRRLYDDAQNLVRHLATEVYNHLQRREYLTIVEEEKKVIAPPPSLQAQSAENRLANQGYEAPSTLFQGAKAVTTFWWTNISRIPTSTTIVPSQRKHQRNRIPKPAQQGPRT